MRPWLLAAALLPLAAANLRDRLLAPPRWWCTNGPDASEHSASIFCRTAGLKDAIAMAEPGDKPAKVEELRAAINRGEAEAEGLDNTNPERQRMMEAWCASDDPARTGDTKTSLTCAKSQAKADFLKRREGLLSFWCGEMGKAGSPKCKQMEFGKKMQETESGEERKRLAIEFKAAATVEERSGLDKETKEMMQAVCASANGEEALFQATCAKLVSSADLS